MNETEKMLEIIHNNRNKLYKENKEKEEKRINKEKKQRRKELIILAVIGFALLIALHVYTERQVKGCMEDGYSENFCRYAGE